MMQDGKRVPPEGYPTFLDYVTQVVNHGPVMTLLGPASRDEARAELAELRAKVAALESEVAELQKIIDQGTDTLREALDE